MKLPAPDWRSGHRCFAESQGTQFARILPLFCQKDRYPKVQTAVQDAQRTLGLVRQHAAEWHVDPHKVGVIGFSAGGHLAAAVSTRFAQRTYPRIDAADELSCRPDFAIVIYPGHLWTPGTDLTLRSDIRVRADTSPTFLLHAEDDPVDPVKHSLTYYAPSVCSALRKTERKA